MSSCIFCKLSKNVTPIYQSEHFFVVFDISPVAQGHLLIVAKEHYMRISEMSEDVKFDLIKLESLLTQVLEDNFDVDGVTIIQNNGPGIMMENTHSHIHVVPRYKEDEFWDRQQIVQHDLDVLKLASLLESILL